MSFFYNAISVTITHHVSEYALVSQ